MITQEQIYGHWNELTGKIKERWGEVTDSELSQAEGNFEQLIGLIQWKTGETRAEIEHWFDRLSEQSSDKVRQAAEAVHGTADDVKQRVRDSYTTTRHVIRQHPAQSVALAFGAGVVIGIVIGLLPRSR
jgi:uncharacterized protein YjbJ (UPF0337 family)